MLYGKQGQYIICLLVLLEKYTVLKKVCFQLSGLAVTSYVTILCFSLPLYPLQQLHISIQLSQRILDKAGVCWQQH